MTSQHRAETPEAVTRAHDAPAEFSLDAGRLDVRRDVDGDVGAAHESQRHEQASHVPRPAREKLGDRVRPETNHDSPPRRQFFDEPGDHHCREESAERHPEQGDDGDAGPMPSWCWRSGIRGYQLLTSAYWMKKTSITSRCGANHEASPPATVAGRAATLMSSAAGDCAVRRR
jgi:hypothetical protein